MGTVKSYWNAYVGRSELAPPSFAVSDDGNPIFPGDDGRGYIPVDEHGDPVLYAMHGDDWEVIPTPLADAYRAAARVMKVAEGAYDSCSHVDCTSLSGCSKYILMLQADERVLEAREAWLDSDEQRAYCFCGDSSEGEIEYGFILRPADVAKALRVWADLKIERRQLAEGTYIFTDRARPVDVVTGCAIGIERQINIVRTVDIAAAQVDDGP